MTEKKNSFKGFFLGGGGGGYSKSCMFFSIEITISEATNDMHI